MNHTVQALILEGGTGTDLQSFVAYHIGKRSYLCNQLALLLVWD